ncbi:tyrosine-type recombinase/integrase [Piscinibacterium candidicorallinum]|uniref:Tyrosine-type recombinase/integrase n=1 Tax=Piscinibacterium candidicorallinum TaxID=1793872 RepID=A0ABV7GWZ0_9BURK
MGRKHTKHCHLPPGIRARKQRSGKVYYYFDLGGRPRKEIPLGTSLVDALHKARTLGAEAVDGAPTQPTVVDMFQLFVKTRFSTLKPRTRSDYEEYFRKLYEYFGNPPAPLDAIRAEHVKEYLDIRGEASKIQANREIAAMSSMFNHARASGLTNAQNPCRGVKRHKEKARDVYVSDAALTALIDAAPRPLQQALRLGHLTALRPGDLFDLTLENIRDGALHVVTSKTEERISFALEGELASLVEEIRNTQRATGCTSLLVNDRGGKYSYSAGDNAFEKARLRAAHAAEGAGATQLAAEIRRAQFRDLRAKAASDVAETRGILDAKALLGHRSVVMTERYVRSRRGKKVKPTK